MRQHQRSQAKLLLRLGLVGAVFIALGLSVIVLSLGGPTAGPPSSVLGTKVTRPPSSVLGTKVTRPPSSVPGTTTTRQPSSVPATTTTSPLRVYDVDGDDEVDFVVIGDTIQPIESDDDNIPTWVTISGQVFVPVVVTILTQAGAFYIASRRAPSLANTPMPPAPKKPRRHKSLPPASS